jgi:prepilin-type N-terminal cleavage/methylation domain-containing protein
MRRKAFTLVELILALTIFAMMLGGLFYAFGVELKFWDKVVVSSSRQQVAAQVMAQLTRDIRSAYIIVPGSNSKELALKVGTSIIGYTLMNDKVRREKDGRAAYLTDQHEVLNLSFAYPAANLVEVKLDEFSTRITLRN